MSGAVTSKSTSWAFSISSRQGLLMEMVDLSCIHKSRAGSFVKGEESEVDS